MGHRPAEKRLDQLNTHAGIFNNIVEQRRRDGLGIEAQFEQNSRHRHRMVNIGLTALAELTSVGNQGQSISAAHQLAISIGQILMDAGDQRLNGGAIVSGDIDCAHALGGRFGVAFFLEMLGDALDDGLLEDRVEGRGSGFRGAFADRGAALRTRDTWYRQARSRAPGAVITDG